MKSIFRAIIYVIPSLLVGCVESSIVDDDGDDMADYEDRQVVQIQSATEGGDLTGLNFIIIGDGYTASDMSQGGLYEVMMKTTMEALFEVEPLASYRDYFNVYFVAAISEDSGVAEGNSTALHSTFGEGTLIGNADGSEDSTDAALSYAKSVSGITHSEAVIVVVVNSSNYAGTTYFYSTGYAIAYCPVVYNSIDMFGQIVHHEAVGHGFGRLLDEYIYYVGETITDEYIAEVEKNKSLYNAGVNISLSASDTPWDHFILDDRYNDVVDTFEGGYFYSKGVWRPEYVSCMCDNRAYFNAPSREVMVQRIMEQSDMTYSYDEFAASDVENSTATPPEPIVYTRSSSTDSETTEHKKLHPPIFIK